MTATAIRQKLADYIRIADEEKIKAIDTMVCDELIQRKMIGMNLL